MKPLPIGKLPTIEEILDARGGPGADNLMAQLAAGETPPEPPKTKKHERLYRPRKEARQAKKAIAEMAEAEERRQAEAEAERLRAEPEPPPRWSLADYIEAQKKYKCKRSLLHFTRGAWPILEPGTPLVVGEHVEIICEYLEAVTAGQIRKLQIRVPPRHMKSTLVSCMWPTWSWIHRPAARFLFGSYSDGLAEKHSTDRRTIIQSDWYRSSWPQQLAEDQNTKREFANSDRGRMTAVGIRGTVTGKGADILVLDDPHKADEQYSKTERESTNRIIRTSFLTRLDNPAEGAIVLIMQRFHVSDIAGEFERDGGWEILELPAIATVEKEYFLPLSKRAWRREVGAILDPQRFPESVLVEKRKTMGAAAFESQYQQRPAPETGLIFDPSWWRFYAPGSVQFEQVLISVDATFKGGSNSDFVAIHAWGIAGNKSYLMHRDTERRGFAATKHAIRAMVETVKSQGVAVLVEDTANGPAIIEDLRREFSVIAVSPSGGKEARAQACAPDIEAGNVYLPDPATSPWVSEFISAAADFPAAAHDDDVDAMTQALNWRRKHSWGVIDAIRDEAMAGRPLPLSFAGRTNADQVAAATKASVEFIRSLSPMSSR